MKAVEMKGRIELRDVDRPEEIFEVDILEATSTRLTVSVPNTIVSFALSRREDDATFTGSLGGRVYVFTENLQTRKGARKRA
jgi:hypothetical protein